MVLVTTTATRRTAKNQNAGADRVAARGRVAGTAEHGDDEWPEGPQERHRRFGVFQHVQEGLDHAGGLQATDE